MKKSNRLLVIFTVCILLSTTSFAQNSYSSTIKFNLPVEGKMTNQGGLEVKCSLLPTKNVSLRQATLDEQPERYLNKKLFTLFISITNTGLNDVIISDWHFQAICPENNHGQQWQETSFINLIVPYIPSSTNILLKPGEKKSFNTGETDFFWCIPKHEESLMTPPCGITGLITCYQIGNPIYNNGNQSGFYGNNCPYIDYDNLLNTGKPGTNGSSGNPDGSGSDGASGSGQEKPDFDSELLALIAEYKKALASGNIAEAGELKKSILEIAGHAYPNQTDEIDGLMKVTPTTQTTVSNTVLKKELQAKVLTSTQSTTSTQVDIKTSSAKNIDFSDWLTIKNPYHCIQVRYKLEKQENDIGYFKVQFRIDFQDKSFCTHPRCLGYLVSFGYPTLDGKDNIYSYYKFYNSFKQVYTVSDLMPIKLSFSDGSKRVLKKDGFYYIAKGSNQEIYCAQLFDKCVDQMMEGSPTSCRDYNESKCLIFK
jgi:hypothetical protein